MDANVTKIDLEEKASKINLIYQASIKQINELGNKAIVLIKSIKGKREQKKIEDITKRLKE